MLEKIGGWFGGEKAEKKEKEPVAQFKLDMARHSIKTKTPEGREPISREGMEMAVKKGLEKERVVLGQLYGSPRERTTQSSLLRKFAERFKDIDFGEIDPQEIVRWFKESGQIEMTETPFLDFQVGEGEYKDELMENFKKGNYLKWTAESSDKRALETKQDPQKVTPLSIQAGNVASFLFAKVWEAYNNNESMTKEEGVDFATSHGGVLESFLYKVIRMKESDAEAKKFVASLDSKEFKENEGFEVEGKVYDKDNVEGWGVKVKYSGKEYVLSAKEIIRIIKEGEDLKQKLEALQEKKD